MSTSETPTSLPAQVSPPEFALSATAPHAFLGAEVVALPVLPADEPGDEPGEGDRGVLIGPGAEELSTLVGTDLLALLEMHGSTGRAGEVVSLPVPGGVPGNTALRWVLLVGVGDQRPADFRRAGAALAREARNREGVATSVAALATADGLEAFVVGAMLGSFAFHWRSQAPEQVPVRRVVLAGLPEPEALATALERGLALGGAGWRARMLATVPSNLKNPAWLAEQAHEVAGECALGIRVWDEEELAAEGFGGILGVGQASATPPRLIRLDYSPPRGRPQDPDRGAGRQGHHLRQRRPVDQARRGDGQHEARHDRRRRRDRGDGRAPRARLPGAGWSAWSPRPRTRSAATRCVPAT